jgi:uncharacterized membrane protein YedE/YeeE
MALLNRPQAPIPSLYGVRFGYISLFLCFLGILFLGTPASVLAQNTSPSSTSNADAELNEALRRANREITALQKLVQAQNASYRRNVDSLNLQIADNIAKLGQNERALNLALEGFEVKYQEQNKAIQEFQDGLQSIKNRQLLTILAVLVAAILVLFVSVQWAFRKAYAKQTNYWNEFQASLLKK